MNIDLNACPLCHSGDRNPGAYAVHNTFHLEHVHEGGYWHRHMFYRQHSHPLAAFFNVETRVLCPVCRHFECELAAHGRGAGPWTFTSPGAVLLRKVTGRCAS